MLCQLYLYTLGQLSQQLKDNQVDQLVFSESEDESIEGAIM